MSNQLGRLLGKPFSLETTTWLCANPKGGYVLVDEIPDHISQHRRMSFTEKTKGRIGYDSEKGVYMLVDEITNLPAYYIAIDEKGQPKVIRPSPAELGITPTPEEIDVMPFVYECIRKGLKDIPNRFKKVKKEIKVWLKQKYSINPKPDGFIDWYIKTNLIPLIKADSALVEIARYFASRKRLASTTGEVYFDSINLPGITHKDVQEYCNSKKQALEAYNQVLQEIPLSASSPDPADAKAATFQWLGPTNATINQLDELYLLLTGTYLESSIEVFRGAFGKGPFMGPANWKATTSELIWLLQELQEHDFLKKTNRQNWQTLVNTFVVLNKKLSGKDLKVLKSNLGINLRVESKEKISSLIGHLLN